MSAAPLPLYMATVLPGLEDVLRSEVAAKIDDASVHETIRGKLFFTSRRPLEQLMTLRTADNLYRHIERLSIGPHRAHLADVEAAVRQLDLTGILDGHAQAASNLTFIVNASRSGKHTYSRFELADAAAQGLSTSHRLWRQGSPEQHDLEFRLDLTGDQGLFSLKLTPASFRYRGEMREFSRAALRPTVAHALIWLSRPQASDRFLDPFCGSGTLITERAAYPSAQIFGGDRNPDALDAARRNMPSVPNLTLNEWDARNLPLDPGSIDSIVTNLPFGQQILSSDEIGGLYLAFVKELRRVLTREGQGILLTDQHAALNRAADRMNVRLEPLLELSLKGLHPHVYRMTLP